MRARWRVSAIACALVGGGIAVGCIDLFHSTDFDTECSLDAAACVATGLDGAQDGATDGTTGGDGPQPGDDGATDGGADAADTTPPPTDFCNLPAPHPTAYRACAWLGACEGTIGNNSFGVCLDNALRAYDCKLNPNRRVIGRTFKFWSCLAQVKTCADVVTCVNDGQSPNCADSGSEFSACANNVHLDCPAKGGAPLSAENCIAVGQTCLAAAGCVGTPVAAASCTSTQCTGTQLQDCFDPGTGVQDVGLDCAQVGGGKCVPSEAGPACLPTGTACTASTTISCNGSAAVGCPAGAQESIDCRSLMEDAGFCNPGAAGRPWDVSRACAPNTVDCAGGGCADDGGTLLGCHRGKTVAVTCASLGLGPCKPSPRLGAPDYACSAP